MRTKQIFVDLTGGDNDKQIDRIGALKQFTRKFSDIQLVVGHMKGQMICKGYQLLQADKNIELVSCETYRQMLKYFSYISDCVFVSAGDTRELVRQSLRIGKINKDFWPILANTYPVANGHVVYGDLGAIAKESIDEQDAIWIGLLIRQMTLILYGKCTMALQNIGEEIHKGGATKEKIRVALANHFPDEFFGNIEMHNLSKYGINCLVSNAIEANNTIKTFAGTQNDMYKKTKQGLLAPITQIAFKLLYALCWQELDWRRYSGGYLLGIKKPILISHGRCDKFGFYCALKRAMDPIIWTIYESINNNLEIKSFTKKAAI